MWRSKGLVEVSVVLWISAVFVYQISGSSPLGGLVWFIADVHGAEYVSIQDLGRLQRNYHREKSINENASIYAKSYTSCYCNHITLIIGHVVI